MNKIPSAQEVIKISENVIERWHIDEPEVSLPDEAVAVISAGSYSGIDAHIEALSIINTALWHQEDRARDPQANDSVIAEVKRKIDKLNQARVNRVEEIDELLFENIKFNDSALLNTETPGSVIDRLTIICLKKYHMKAEAERADSTEQHRGRCSGKLDGIVKQLSDIASAYDQLLEEIERGGRRYAMYRQFKMYNDPELNPVLYRRKK